MFVGFSQLEKFYYFFNRKNIQFHCKKTQKRQPYITKINF